jgi:hypothetical protein
VGEEREKEKREKGKDKQKETKHAHHDEILGFLGDGGILRSEAMHI